MNNGLLVPSYTLGVANCFFETHGERVETDEQGEFPVGEASATPWFVGALPPLVLAWRLVGGGLGPKYGRLAWLAAL